MPSSIAKDVLSTCSSRQDTSATTSVRAPCDSLPDVDWLLGNRRYDADWFGETSKDKEIRACVPSSKQRKTPVKHDERRDKRSNGVEILFGRLEDGRRVAARYDRCPKVFPSTIALAAAVISCLSALTLA